MSSPVVTALKCRDCRISMPRLLKEHTGTLQRLMLGRLFMLLARPLW